MNRVDIGKVMVTPKGDWDSAVSYEKLDLVFYEGSSYAAKEANVGVIPTADDSIWMLAAQAGSDAKVCPLVVDSTTTVVDRTLVPDYVYKYTANVSSLSFDLQEPTDNSRCHIYTVIFHTGESCTLTPRCDLLWVESQIPALEDNSWYQLSICENLAIIKRFGSVE